MSITFTQGANSVTINRGVSRETQTYKERLNSAYVQSMSGASMSFSEGPNIIKTNLVIHYVTETEAKAFESWLIDSVKLYRNTFSITPDSVNDFGNGSGVTVNNCKYEGGTSTAEIIQVNPAYNQRYTISFPFSYVESEGGAGDL